MNDESKNQVLHEVGWFTLITYIIGSIFMYFAINTGDVDASGGLYVLGGMWSPGIAAVIMLSFYRRPLTSFGWGWGKTKYQLGSYLLPAAYVLAAQIIVWTTGLGGLVGEPLGKMVFGSLKNAIMWTGLACIFALGEEIGWSGYFAPRLAGIMSFTQVALARGLVWSVWHYPLIIWSDYGPVTLPLWYKLLIFTIVMTAISFPYTWLRLQSGSIWTGMFMHASHNLFIQKIFPPLTINTGKTDWFVNEFGLVVASVTIVVAIIFWRRKTVTK